MVAAGGISADGMAVGATGMRVAMAAIGMGVAGTGAIGMGADGTEDHIRTDGRPTGGWITLATSIALMLAHCGLRDMNPLSCAPQAFGR
jgi:hypothetical protein